MTKSQSCLFRFLLMRPGLAAPPFFCHGRQVPVLRRLGLTVVLLCLVLGPGTSLAFDDYRSCPHRIAAPAGLRAQRGPGAEEVSVRWDSLLPGNLPEAAVQVHMTAGQETFVGVSQGNERSVSFEGLPRGSDLYIEAAFVVGPYLVSEIGQIYIAEHQIRSHKRVQRDTVTAAVTVPPPLPIVSNHRQPIQNPVNPDPEPDPAPTPDPTPDPGPVWVQRQIMGNNGERCTMPRKVGERWTSTDNSCPKS